MKCKIRVIRGTLDIIQKYRPIVGQIYDAEYSPSKKRSSGVSYCAPFCIINILDKRIVLRKGEFEIVGGSDNGN